MNSTPIGERRAPKSRTWCDSFCTVSDSTGGLINSVFWPLRRALMRRTKRAGTSYASSSAGTGNGSGSFPQRRRCQKAEASPRSAATRRTSPTSRSIQADPLETMPPLNETAAETSAAMRQLASRLGRSLKAGETPEQGLGLALRQVGAADALRQACKDAHSGVIRPTRADRLDLSGDENRKNLGGPFLFPDAASEPYPTDPVATPGGSPALRGFLAALSLARDPEDDERAAQPIRGHLFLHNQQGLWVCVDPACTHVNVLRDDRNRAEEAARPRCGALHRENGAELLVWGACPRPDRVRGLR